MSRLPPLVILLAIAACGDGPTDPSDQLGLHIIAGGGARDTVGARIAAPVVVQYRDPSGELKSGVQVRFEVVGYGNPGPQLLIGPGANSDPVETVVAATTNEAGRATVSVRMWRTAGTGWIRVTAPQLALADSVSFEVLPGAAARLELAPIDTAVYVDATIQLRARTMDQWGNERTGDPVAWSSAPGIIATTNAGQIRGVAHGRAFARATLGPMVDSLGVSVVPRGVIAALFDPVISFEAQYILVFETNGSNVRRIDAGINCAHGLEWANTQDRLIFGRNPSPWICFTQRLYSTTLTGAVTRLRPDTGTIDAEYGPRLTRDDQWVYFMGRPDHQNGELWRVRLDGTDAELIGPAAASWWELDEHPSPSPDGSQVVYASNRTGGIVLHVLDVATRGTRSLGVTGHSPSWSPRGDLIAFKREDVYYVMKADGTEVRSLVEARSSSGYSDVPSWSPDGEWIVAVVRDPGGYAPIYGKLALVNVETGVVLPLGWTKQLMQPSWKPSG